ncbi:MAG: hypothetical protein Q9219_002910 [cf. Caloplaca sp. 3 TL-2023]
MSSPYTIPDRSLSHPNPQNLSSTVIAYLKSIATNERPLSPPQLQELQTYSSTAHVEATIQPEDAVSRATGLDTSATSQASPTIDMKHLLSYMTSSEVDAAEELSEQDLGYPISNYFINSSHNTYLTGNQLYTASNSAEESLSLPAPWVSASTATRAEPRVLHGYTLTREVPFREVCIAIRDAAFAHSLEVHAGKEQQAVMVEIIEEVWKGLLVGPLFKECEQLPSPADLKRKILIKVKYAAPEKVEAQVVKATTPTLRRKISTSSSSDSDNQGSEDLKKKKKSSIIEPLSALGVYTRSYHFKDLSSPEAAAPCHVFSLSEKKFMDVHESHGPTLFSHNRNFFMRAFPSGTRVSSSNLDPAVFWRKGVQMVALNWQRYDAGMMLNEGMFAGSTGWVLKPKEYRGQRQGQTAAVSDESQGDAVTHKTLSLSIEIFAGQNLPLPIGDRKSDSFRPYVKCELHVEKPEERANAPIEAGGKSKDGEYKAKTKTSRGIDPDFGGEKVDFLKVPSVVEVLSFIRFKIQDDEIGKDDLAAWACIRLDRLKTGFRFVRLLDATGDVTQGMLLVNVKKIVA